MRCRQAHKYCTMQQQSEQRVSYKVDSIGSVFILTLFRHRLKTKTLYIAECLTVYSSLVSIDNTPYPLIVKSPARRRNLQITILRHRIAGNAGIWNGQQPGFALAVE